MGLEDLESHFAVYPQGAFYKNTWTASATTTRAR